MLRSGAATLSQFFGLGRVGDNPRYRSDIDGLRALAIILVVGYHFYPRRFSGGFVGVDVFFVISGFLITQVILKEMVEGNFRLMHFFSRRILRLFPSLIVLLLCLASFCWLTFTASEYAALGKHLAGSAAYISNFLLWLEAGYFDESALRKPLLHMWSLAIEEQYYLVWPILLPVLFGRARWCLPVILLIGAASFALNAVYAGRSDGLAFYMPYTRAWELLIGATLAVSQMTVSFENRRGETFLARGDFKLKQILKRFPVLARDFPSAIGLALIVIAAFTLNEHTRYPGFAALLPVAGTFLLIGAGAGSRINTGFLSHPLLVWIGLISYPLYLWHWPLLSVSATLISEFPSRGLRAALLLLAILLAWASCKFVEMPVRKGAGLLTTMGLLCGVIFIGAAGLAILAGSGLPNRGAIAGYDERNKAYESRLKELDFSFKKYPTALCKENFPDSGWCLYAADRNATIALIGDSHAHHFYPGLARVFAQEGENLALLGSAGCPPLLGIVSHSGNGDDWCHLRNSVIHTVTAKKSLHTVILAANWHLYINGKSFKDSSSKSAYWQLEQPDRSSEDNVTIFRRQLEFTLRKLIESGKKVFFVDQIPELDYDPKSCLRRPRSFVQPRECLIKRARVDAYLAEYETVVNDVLGKFSGIGLIKPVELMCDKTVCSAFRDGRLMYRDHVHLSMFGSHYLASEWGLQFLPPKRVR